MIKGGQWDELLMVSLSFAVPYLWDKQVKYLLQIFFFFLKKYMLDYYISHKYLDILFPHITIAYLYLNIF